MRIIDFRLRPRLENFYKNIYPELSPELKAYERVFDSDGRAKERRYPTSLDESIEEMKAGGVSQAVVFAGNGASNEDVFEVCQKYPNEYFGLAAADPRDGITKAYDSLRVAYTDYRLHGVNLGAWQTGVPATDRRCYPLFALSESMGKLVELHSSIHYNSRVPLSATDPMHIDQLAVDFPNLRIVMSHAGLGFGLMAMSVAMRHKNVYLEFSGLSPRFVPREMLHAINSILRKRALFGTNYPALGFEAQDEWKKVIREENQPLFFRENALRALGVQSADNG